MRLPRYDSLEESLIGELAEYERISIGEVKTRISGAKVNLKEKWESLRGKSATDFYIDNEHYLYDLTKFHALYGHCEPVIAVLEYCRRNGLRKALDFGAGIGSAGIAFARAGLDVTLADIASNLLDYAKWRFDKRSLKATFVDLRNEALPENAFDVVIASDVLEHVEHPSAVLQSIQRCLRDGGCFFFNVVETPGEDKPMHITRGVSVLQEMRGLGFRRLASNPVPMHGYVKVTRFPVVNGILRCYDRCVYYPLRSLVKRMVRMCGIRR